MVWVKRTAAVLTALVVCVGAFWIADNLHWEESEHIAYTFTGEPYFDELEEYYQVSGGILEDCKWTVTGADPWLVLPTYGLEMEIIRVRFSEPATTDFVLQVYYCGEDEEPAEQRSVIRTVHTGDTEVDFPVPDAAYEKLRLDINGDVILESVEGGYNIPYTLSYTPDIKTILLRGLGTGLAVAAFLILLLQTGRMKRFLIALGVGVLVASAVEAGDWVLSPQNLRYELNGKISELNLNGGACYGCEYSDGTVTPTGNDPQWHFSNWGRTTTGVLIRLSEPAKEDLPVRIYYVGDKLHLSNVNSMYGVIAQGTDTLGLNLHTGDYDLLRFDFDQPTPVSGISVSADRVSSFRVPFRPDMIRWGIIAGSLIFLCFFASGKNWFADSLKRIRDLLLNPLTRHPAVEWLYAGIAVILVLYHIYISLCYPTILNGMAQLKWIWVFMAGISILLGQMWKDKGFWILVALLALKILRVWFPDPQAVPDIENTVFLGIFAFFVCYSVGKILRPALRRIFLVTVCIGWTLAVTILSSIGIWTCWTGIIIPNLSGGKWFIMDGRLNAIYYATTTAGILSGSVGLALILLFMTKSKILRVLDILAILILILANGLTGTRTTYITIAFAVSLLICILLYNRMKEPVSENHRRLKQAGRICALGVFGLTLMVALMFGQTYIPDIFNSLRDGGGVISHAIAESSEAIPVQMEHRGFLNFDSLNALLTGRVSIWNGAVQVIRDDPSILINGVSVSMTMSGPDRYVGFNAEHCHNIWLETLLENGIPGLILLIAFQVYFLVHAMRLIRNKTLPMWERLIPFPAIVILIGELMECLTILKNGFPPLTFFYLFAGFTVAVSLRPGLPDGRGARSEDNRLQGRHQRPDADLPIAPYRQ